MTIAEREVTEVKVGMMCFEDGSGIHKTRL